MRKIAIMILPVLLLSFMITGCGGGVSEDKPLSEVTKDAQAMSAAQLKSMVSKYQAAIESKKTEISKLTTEIQKIPIAQAMGEEAKKLRNDMQKVSSSVKALADRLNVYAQELKKKM